MAKNCVSPEKQKLLKKWLFQWSKCDSHFCKFENEVFYVKSEFDKYWRVNFEDEGMASVYIEKAIRRSLMNKNLEWVLAKYRNMRGLYEIHVENFTAYSKFPVLGMLKGIVRYLEGENARDEGIT